MIKVGSYIFAANKSGWVDLFDVSDMSDPFLAGALETKNRFSLSLPHDIDRYGDHIVIVDPNGFKPPVGKVGLIKAMEDGVVLPVEDWKLVGKVEGEALIGANRVQGKRGLRIYRGKPYGGGQ